MSEEISIRVGKSVSAIKQAFTDNLAYVQGRFSPVASVNDYYMALAYTVRDHLMDYWTKTAKTYFEKESRTVCYFSAEYLLGPQLGSNLINLGIYQNVKIAMTELNLNLDELIAEELEPGLGNGGLGRLAACYMDSLATLNIPAIGYGIRYEFGIFNQEIRDGWQVESTDKWLCYGNPWEVPRPEIAFSIKFGGRTENYIDGTGRYVVKWIPDRIVRSVAYDTPIIGYKANTANFLRLWKAEACESFDFQAFNIGDYYGAVHEKMSSENITKVLYPNDEPLAGKELRLEQQYFFASSALQDMIRIYLQREKNLDQFAKKYTVQLNDTHPAIGIAELMRLLIDEYEYAWDKAWEITCKVFNYTNHTLLPEALEKWPLALFARLLPRHLEIIYEINWRFLKKVKAKYPDDISRIRRMSLIDESDERYVRMANLACVASSKINGVSELHSKLLAKEVLKDFYELWPDKFSNKTNGVSPRRFLLLNNPRLADLITETVGGRWLKDLSQLQELTEHVNSGCIQAEWQQIKRKNKQDLANIIAKQIGVILNPDSLFDIQAKRIHEYKRPHLNLLHVIALYNRLRQNPNLTITPRSVIFSGKAAPGYYKAKLIIKLINSVAEVVNNDPKVKDQLKVVFYPNYNVKNAQWLFAACDLSEQISTAGKEASGTGNMKFALNGALTIGTLDGANIEIREEVRAENFFLFGLTANEVEELWAKGYRPETYINANQELREALELIMSGYFSNGDKNLFKSIVDELKYHDEFMLCADFASYLKCQEQVATEFADTKLWTKKSILNTARMGKFSSDRAIREYCADIWQIQPVKIV
ncbi:MAG: glycogen/starch/alpha-glucan phosphorylase [Gammaproteobacteria bacterium]|nr:glycogen/starch/alpha-glucan phosphorylase [Gammaproteobacteria bacterium]